MATLSQTLRGLPQADTQISRGPGGVLQQKKTLQQATQQAGLAAAPTTPLGAQTLGATPKAADMAGTPQQLGAALKASTEPVLDLQTALRRKQVRTLATPEELGRITKSASMQPLGGLGDRVTNFIDNEKKKLEQVTEQQAGATPVAAVSKYQGKDISSLAPDLQKLREKPTDQALMLKVQQGLQDLGITTGPLTPALINELYQSATEVTASAAAKEVADKLTVSDLLSDPEFGYSSQQLSQLLGIPETELVNYTVKQLSDKVNQIASTEFTEAAAMEKQAASPMAGIAERGLAREAGRELSATGIRSTEADMQRMADTISRADRVTFAGRDMSVDELLKDENISAIVKDYLESPIGSQIRKDIDENEPELSKFIQTHQTVLSKAAATLETSATEFKQIQEDNKALVNDYFGGISVDPKVQEQLVPGSTGMSATRIKPENSLVLSYLKNKTPDERKTFTTEVAKVASTHPSVSSEISKLTPEQLTALNISGNGKKWKTYKSTLEDNKDVNNLESDETNSILMHYSPNISSADEVNSDIELNNTMSNLGFGDSSYNTGTIPIKDNKVDTDNLKSTFLTNTPVPTVADAADGKIKSATFTYKEPALPDVDTPKGRVLKYWKDFGKEGKVPTLSDIETRIHNTLSDLGKYAQVPTTKFLETSQELLDKKYEAELANWEEINKMIDDLKASGTWAKWKLTDEHANNINRPPIKQKAFKIDLDLNVGNLPNMSIKL